MGNSTNRVNRNLFPNGRRGDHPPYNAAHPTPAGGTKNGAATPILPPPSTFDIPDKFPSWRLNQDRAVQDIVVMDKRFLVCVGPTGLGKSLVYVTAAVITGERSLILTSTNPLLEQIVSDFGALCVPVKGKSNYRCRALGRDATCDRGPCNFGQACGMKDSGCEYYDQVRKARGAQIVVTNYAFWIYNNKARLASDTGGDESGGIGDFGLLVCDEAHDAPNKVADAYEVQFSQKNEVERYLMQPYPWNGEREDVVRWVTEARREVERLYRDAKGGDRIERTFQASAAKRKLAEVAGILNTDPTGDNTVIVPEKRWGQTRIAVAWPFDRSFQVLFKDIPRVVFVSATVREKTVRMLGVDPGDCVEHEYPHIIPMARRMMYHIPTVRMNHRTDEIGVRTWLTRIDQIAKSRLGTNGIIHPVSYARRNLILKRSKYSEWMMSHGRDDAYEAIEKFKGERGKILVSPSVTTGYDFPDDTARWQIIGKIAFPDTSDPVTKERCKRDDEYSPYVAMQTLVQTVGRIVRGERDWGESFIIDDNIGWFMQRYGRFAPGWFMGSYRKLSGVPQPMEFD